MAANVFVEELLRGLEVRTGGARPNALQVHDSRFFTRVLAHSSLSLVREI